MTVSEPSNLLAPGICAMLSLVFQANGYAGGHISLFPPKGKVEVYDDDTTALANTLRDAAKCLDLLYIILPAKDHPLYPQIKRLCDVQYGLQTICNVGSKLVARSTQTEDQYARSLDQYLRNVALKFNLKLGATNQTVENLRSSIIQRGQDHGS
ncbi:hypothetical protein BDV29DRAFT_158687 [Aspergillus leporis]|uniref:Piwi domain-containing protein n=1 Tax=Aspergillus leporis TaxID=41062 RepID=A0A5N5WX22_9EURO|nr:hypothetical protein BDV29DRAFT_158687 [Aspergillus leporis]